MKLWQRHTSNVLGVDIGSSAIKIVELAQIKERLTLVTYGVAEDISDLLHREGPEGVKVVGEVIAATVKAARCSTRIAVGGLPNFSIFSAVVTLPAMPKSDLAGAVKWEAAKVVPMPIEEVVLDWQVVRAHIALEKNTPSSDAKKDDNPVVDVLLTAAPKTLVERYMSIIAAAGLEFASLETESFATARSLVGFDPTTVMIIDIGGTVTSLTIIADRIPALTRSIDFGGQTTTQAVANLLGVDIKRAEAFKRDLGANPDAGANVLEGAPKAIHETVEAILNEVRYMIELYEKEGNHSIEKIICTGGGALLPRLVDTLSATLNRRVFLGDPWARVATPNDLRPILDEVGPRFSVALGLAMRNFS